MDAYSSSPGATYSPSSAARSLPRSPRGRKPPSTPCSPTSPPARLHPRRRRARPQRSDHPVRPWSGTALCRRPLRPRARARPPRAPTRRLSARPRPVQPRLRSAPPQRAHPRRLLYMAALSERSSQEDRPREQTSGIWRSTSLTRVGAALFAAVDLAAYVPDPRGESSVCPPYHELLAALFRSQLATPGQEEGAPHGVLSPVAKHPGGCRGDQARETEAPGHRSKFGLAGSALRAPWAKPEVPYSRTRGSPPT